MVTGLVAHTLIAEARPLPATLNDWMQRQQQADEQLAAQSPKRVTTGTSARSVGRDQSQILALSGSGDALLGEQVSVNINTADSTELMAKLDSIGRKKAQAIIDYRQKHGPYRRVDDLLAVKGIGPSTLEKNRAHIRLQ